MATSNSIIDFLAHGTHAARPASLTLASGAVGIYYEDDTSKAYLWDGSTWQQISAAGGAGTPGGSNHQIQYNNSGAFGGLALTNGQLLIGSTGATPATATLTAGTNITITNGAGTITIAASGGGGGLWSAKMSGTVPTQANTGLNSWLLQPASATVTNDTCGITVYCPSQSSQHTYATIKKAAPATPYTITALIAHTAVLKQYSGPVFGWSDGTKALVLNPTNGYGIQTVYNTNVSNGTVTQKDTKSEVPNTTSMMPPQIMWMRINDDGTNVTISLSMNGGTYRTHYTEVKASGVLANYDTVCFGLEAYSQEGWSTLMDWIVT